LEPEFDLESMQKKGLQIIYESKSRLLSCVEDFYAELIEQYKALTFNYSITKQKESIRDKAKQIISNLEKFTNKNMNAKLMEEFCKNDYSKEEIFLEKSIETFINKTKKEYRLPRLITDEEQLEMLNDVLLNYIHIRILPENKERAVTQQHEKRDAVLKVSTSNYFSSERKFLHALLPLEKKVLLYDITTAKTTLLPVRTFDPLPQYMQTVMTPNLNLYFFGGMDRQGAFSKHTYLYQPDGTLNRLANMLIGKLAQGKALKNYLTDY
jgi:hypothetical protein